MAGAQGSSHTNCRLQALGLDEPGWWDPENLCLQPEDPRVPT